MVTANGRIGPDNLAHVKDLLKRCSLLDLNDREDEFVTDLSEKVTLYGANAFMSDAQYEWLDAIAERE